MAVTEKDLREYLRLPPDSIEVIGEASINRTVFTSKVEEGGVYTFTKTDNGWLLNGATVLLSEYGITPVEGETKISVDYLTYKVEKYLSAAKSKARAAGVPAFKTNAQYDMFIIALASMYYDNRGMVFDDPRNEQAARNMINSFALELRYAEEDAT